MQTDSVTRFFECFFRELGKADLPYAILHGYEQLPEQMSSDIDFGVRHQDLRKLLPIQREVARRQGWLLISVVQAKLSAHYAVFIDPQEPRHFIQLDACGHYVESGCFVLSDEQLLANCRPFKFFKVPAPAAEFTYVFAKALLKNKGLELQFQRLRELWRLDAAGAEAGFKKLSDVDGLEQWFERPVKDWERELRPKVLANTRFGLINLCREFARMLRRVLRPVGLHIAIYGPDGVGKSTLISQLMLPCFRQVRQFHFRPGVLGKKVRGPVAQPHGGRPRSRLSGMAKICYYFADHWFGYLFQVFPARVRNELVIFDRSFLDLLVDPRRYRLAGSSGLARLLNRLLPQPDMTIVLDAPAELVRARKPELEIEELRRQREVLRQLAVTTPGCSVVSAAQSPEEVLRSVQKEMIQFLARRENSRQGEHGDMKISAT